MKKTNKVKGESSGLGQVIIRAEDEPRTVEPKTNVELVTEYMEFSRAGALAQAFIIHAMNVMSHEVIEQADKLRLDMKDSYIHPEAWIRCATEWKRISEEAGR